MDIPTISPEHYPPETKVRISINMYEDIKFQYKNARIVIFIMGVPIPARRVFILKQVKIICDVLSLGLLPDT